MPAALVETVITAAGWAGQFAEVLEIAGGFAAGVFVVAGRGAGAGFELAPGGGVAVAEFGGGAIRVSVVAQSEDQGLRVALGDEGGGSGGTGVGGAVIAAVGDVAGGVYRQGPRCMSGGRGGEGGCGGQPR